MDTIVEIKQVVNSLDSGIEEENVRSLISLLSELGEEIQDQKNACTIVKMMQSTSRYLASKTHTAHPDTLPLLSTLAQDLEILVSEPGTPVAEVQQIMATCIRAFKSLKARIAKSSPISEEELQELKAVILSIDWEITESTLKNFDRIITRLKEKLKSNKLHYTFLRIMHSLGGYISRNKASVDKNSTNLLQSVFRNYEKMVQHPQMAQEEKKQMIEGDIRAYNEFKKGSAVWEETESMEEDDLPPALSHVDSAPALSGAATLNTLAESSGAVEEMTPALAGTDTKPSPPRDVMGDLFSPKISPADELLDEIHLSELHGAQSPNPLGMAAHSQRQEDGPGIKQFVPQRGGEVPIPEIESRLDEFFNLDVTENRTSERPAVDSGDPEPMTPVFFEEAEPEEGIISEPEPEFEPIPEAEFEPGPDLTMEMVPEDGIELIEPDHSAEGQDAHSLLMAELKEDPADPILERLKASLTEPSKLTELAVTQTLEDLSRLGELWASDTDKTSLVDLLTGLVRYINTKKEIFHQQNTHDEMGHGSEVQVMDDPLEEETIESVFVEDELPAGEEVSDTDGSTLLEDDTLTEDVHDENEQEDIEMEADMPGDDIFEVEKTPKGFWGRLKSIFRN